MTIMASKSSRSPDSVSAWAQELAAEVRRKRKLLKLTQKELADLAQCGPDFLYDLERGKPTVRLDKLVPVLEVLGLRLKLEPRQAR
jgi:y4mF family transcriptional regulator